MGLDYKPTWLTAVVCTIIVAISLAFERLLHYTGKYLKQKNKKPLFDALQKVKEELMVLGFISLLLNVFQNKITKICVPIGVLLDLLPCDLPEEEEGGGSKESLYCDHNKDMVQLFSHEDLHNLHEFIFVLAIAHVILSVLTVVSGEARMRQWKHWEVSLANECSDVSEEGPRITLVQGLDFIKRRFTGIEKYSTFLGWLQCFLRQFYKPVSKSDYEALRRGFITAHCRGSPKFNFHKYMLHALEDDFETIVGISWYLWVIVVIFLLLNISGWNTYVWIAFIPFILLLAVGTKLEHIITQLAHEVAEKHTVVIGELVVKPSDDHFWFHRPQIILYLIHFILFQNAFEITYLFWYLFQSHSCKIVEPLHFIVRLIIGVIIRILCSYSTMPLYAIVTQMGTHLKKSIFDEHMQDGIVGDGSTGGSY